MFTQRIFQLFIAKIVSLNVRAKLKKSIAVFFTSVFAGICLCQQPKTEAELKNKAEPKTEAELKTEAEPKTKAELKTEAESKLHQSHTVTQNAGC